MAQEYKVLKVSQEPPKEYEGKFGTVYYVKTMLEGHEKPVSIGKKDPSSLTVGSVVYGDIKPTEFDTDNFKAADKFTADKQSFGGGFKGQPRDDASIKAQWAINAALQYLAPAIPKMTSELEAQGQLEKWAKWFYAEVDVVKGQKPATEPQNAPKRDWESVGKPKEPEYDDLTDDDGNKIPF